MTPAQAASEASKKVRELIAKADGEELEQRFNQGGMYGCVLHNSTAHVGGRSA